MSNLGIKRQDQIPLFKNRRTQESRLRLMEGPHCASCRELLFLGAGKTVGRNMLSLTQLMTFAAVAKARSITKAAQSLHISQPAVSKHLKNLEETYSVKLFERDGGVLELSESGRIFLRRANAVLAHLDKLKEELRPSPRSESIAHLKIAGSYSSSAVLLPSVIADFQKKHRNARIILRTGSSNNMKAMLLNSEVELAVINERPENPQLAAEPFREENLVVFVAANYPLARKKDVSLSDLNTTTLTATGGKGRLSTTEKILKKFAHQGLTARVSIRCSTPEAVKAIVKKGLGAGILFEDAVMPDIKKKVFKQLTFPDLKLQARSYLVYYRDRPLSAQALEFLSLLRQRNV